MTTIWGPLGWMTLHSVATSYPERPTQTEQNLMSTWLDMFRDTITCPSCKGHFTELLATYRTRFPNMMQSRQEFALFSFRAHNAVNRRLNKPVYGTVDECMATLKANLKTRTARDYRISYINHITRHWRTFQDVSGITSLKKIMEMKKIEDEYVQPRDTSFNVPIFPDLVILPMGILERNVETPVPGRPAVRFAPGGPRRGLVLGAGGFRIR
jgi:hypothetical protein